MNYKQISKANYFTCDLLETVCNNRGVDTNKIKNPSIEDTIHYSKLLRLDKVVNAIKIFSKRESSEIGIIVDSDADR